MRSSALLVLLATLVLASCSLLVAAMPTRRTPTPPPTPPTPSGGGNSGASSVTPAAPLNVASFGAGPVVFVTAHPDDIEACAGGLVSQLTAQGTEVHYVILTNGDKGCSNPTICNDTVSSEEIAVWRAAEAVNAASVLGVPASNVVLMDYEDAMLTSYDETEVRQRITAILRQIKPIAMFVWHPYPTWSLEPSAGWYDLGFHPDHQASARFAIDAHANSGTSRLWPELGEAWKIPELYMFDFVAPNFYVDIGLAGVAIKAKAYQAHVSQIPNPSFIEPFLLNVAVQVGNLTNMQTNKVQYAEGYLGWF